jgi:V/A-type H+/Na+-transporting ATPase subunit B
LLGQVIKIENDLVTVHMFAKTSGISTDDPVHFCGHSLPVNCSGNMLGRIFTGIGRPRDNGPELTDNLIPVELPDINPCRQPVSQQLIRTNIPIIDIFNPLMRAQKHSILTSAGKPYIELLSRIATQAEVDLIIVGGVGLKYDEYLSLSPTPPTIMRSTSAWVAIRDNSSIYGFPAEVKIECFCGRCWT